MELTRVVFVMLIFTAFGQTSPGPRINETSDMGHVVRGGPICRGLFLCPKSVAEDLAHAAIDLPEGNKTIRRSPTVPTDPKLETINEPVSVPIPVGFL